MRLFGDRTRDRNADEEGSNGCRDAKMLGNAGDQQDGAEDAEKNDFVGLMSHE